jgi:glycosyltransferase involved in cell wall biosynthesis
MPLPKITVVTPSYNQGRFIERTLRSVLDQGYPSLEYIVIDGGSTDGSVDVIRRCEGSLAYWVSEPDQGQTYALIKGFARSTGEIQCWLNSDDLFEPWTLREVATFFSEHPDVRVVYGDSLWIDETDRQIRLKKEQAFSRFIWMYDHNFIPQPSTFWRRDLYEQVGGLDPRFDLSMDADLWIRFAEVTKLHHVRRRWSRLRSYREQKMQRLKAQAVSEDLEIRNRYLDGEAPWSRSAKKGSAKALRIAWKGITGCYW